MYFARVVLLEITSKDPAFWGYAAFTIILALFILLGFLYALLDFFGGPFVNTITSVWQRFYFVVTKKYFKSYLQLNKKALPLEQQQFLFDQLFFYKKLNLAQRRAFDDRVVRFKETRIFSARENVVLTEEMKLLISATAVQITFGLRSYLVKEFATIWVYPKAYFNKMSDQFHKGEVNPKGLVVLNWEDFYRGIQIPDDDLNLGIHEFAHTLALQRLQNRAFSDRVFVQLFDKLMRNISNPVFRKQIKERAGLRNYALANPMEFFAVTTEAFFENPETLFQNHHTIYQLFAEMYNQDLRELYSRNSIPLAHSTKIITNN